MWSILMEVPHFFTTETCIILHLSVNNSCNSQGNVFLIVQLVNIHNLLAVSRWAILTPSASWKLASNSTALSILVERQGTFF